MTQINQVTQSQPNNSTLGRDLALCITAGIAFMQVGIYSNGWFLTVVTYIVAVVALFTTITRHNNGTVHQRWFHIINALGCTGVVAALWFSGKMATMF